MRPAILTAIGWMVLALPAAAQETLAWTLREGQTLYLERVYRQKQTIDVKNKAFQQTSSNTWISKLDVHKVTDTDIVVDQTVISVVFKKDQPKPMPQDRFAERLKGSKFRITLTPAGRIRKFEGYDDLVARVADKDEAEDKALRFLVPESALREGVEEVLGFLPTSPVQPGDRWQREASESVPPFGSFRSTYRYTYDGRKDDIDRITFTVDMKYVPPAKEMSLFRVVKGQLSADDGAGGSARFSPRTGRILGGEKRVIVRGNLLLEAAGNQTEMRFVSENELTWRVLDAEPK